METRILLEMKIKNCGGKIVSVVKKIDNHTFFFSFFFFF